MASRKLSINLLSQNSAGAEHIPNVAIHCGSLYTETKNE
jgi:hypothetical protein